MSFRRSVGEPAVTLQEWGRVAGSVPVPRRPPTAYARDVLEAQGLPREWMRTPQWDTLRRHQHARQAVFVIAACMRAAGYTDREITSATRLRGVDKAVASAPEEIVADAQRALQGRS